MLIAAFPAIDRRLSDPRSTGTENTPALDFWMSLLITPQQPNLVHFPTTMQNGAAVRKTTWTVPESHNREKYVCVGLGSQVHGAIVRPAINRAGVGYFVFNRIVGLVGGCSPDCGGHYHNQNERAVFHVRHPVFFSLAKMNLRIRLQWRPRAESNRRPTV